MIVFIESLEIIMLDRFTEYDSEWKANSEFAVQFNN